jgi:hypothetical protein
MPAENLDTKAAADHLEKAADLLEDKNGGEVAREKAQTHALIAVGHALIGAVNIYVDNAPGQP